MKFLFLITSAVKTKFGVHTSGQRLAQTIGTVNSIKTRVPSEKLNLVMLECSGEAPDQDTLAILSQNVDRLLSFSADPTVARVYQSTNNWDIVKNVTEMMIFGAALKALKESNYFEGFDRVFKISGRYFLNDNFDISYYEQDTIKDKTVIKRALPSQFEPHTTGGATQQYMSRLWSFPTARVDEVIAAYDAMLADMVSRVNSGGYIDIEHLLYKHLDHEKLVESNVMGVSGFLGPSGMLVND